MGNAAMHAVFRIRPADRTPRPAVGSEIRRERRTAAGSFSRVGRVASSAALAAVSVWFLAGPAPAPASAGSTVRDGKARFEVITPSLIRLEYAADGEFENTPTQTTEGRLQTDPRFRTGSRNGIRTIKTSHLTLRWERRSGPFGKDGLRVRVGKRELRPKLGPNPAPLGGWRRSLDLVDGPVPLHEGMLSRVGWYLLDDSRTALMERGWFEERPAREGPYRDLYLFAYGHDYKRGLRDLRKLTGPAPLLPRKAFGVWFSRWWPYGSADWRALVERFRAEKVPLDTISIDTDFKRVNDSVGAAIAAETVGAPGKPYSWNGWDWNESLYPDPSGFLDWARGAGLEVGLNLHPSISSTDPRFGEAQAKTGGELTASSTCRVAQADTKGMCMVFDWADRGQLDAYFDLHETFEDDGPVFWWLDWCCDGTSAGAPGLTPDTWINRHYYERQRERGLRWPAFQRIGGSYQKKFDGAVGNGAFAEHRYTLQFTGDTCGSWPMLEFASEFTAAAASIGMPYVSHDIGTFHAVSSSRVCDKDLSPILTPRENSLPADMYVRWVQFGAFQPIERLHSHHGRRLPWEYPPEAERIATRFLRLRGQLNPYLYTLAHHAHRTGIPMVRPLYLQWPKRDEAYEHPAQYTLGEDVLVAPVAEEGDPAESTVWFPPGTWVDWFTGERHRGPASVELAVPLSRMPVFVRAGGIVPMQPRMDTTPEGSPRKLVLVAQRGDGRTTVYDDSGKGFAYERGQSAQTSIWQRRRHGVTKLTIGKAGGQFRGQRTKRRWEIHFAGQDRPERVEVEGELTRRWHYDPGSRTITVNTGPRRVGDRLSVKVE